MKFNTVDLMLAYATCQHRQPEVTRFMTDDETDHCRFVQGQSGGTVQGTGDAANYVAIRLSLVTLTRRDEKAILVNCLHKYGLHVLKAQLSCKQESN